MTRASMIAAQMNQSAVGELPAKKSPARLCLRMIFNLVPGPIRGVRLKQLIRVRLAQHISECDWVSSVTGLAKVGWIKFISVFHQNPAKSWAENFPGATYS